MLDISFRNQMPMMQELLELDAEGALEGAPAQWFRDARDPEELYDLSADPHELRNLAGELRFQGELVRMRGDLDRWLEESGDLGLMPEEELRERMWPGGEQPETAAPQIEIADGTTRIHSASAGASIGKRIDSGPWRLYTEAFATPSGSCVEARAIRYGWSESDSTEACAGD